MTSKRMNMDLSSYSDGSLKEHLSINDIMTADLINRAEYGPNTISAIAEQIGRQLLIRADVEEELARRAQLDSKSEP